MDSGRKSHSRSRSRSRGRRGDGGDRNHREHGRDRGRGYGQARERSRDRGRDRDRGREGKDRDRGRTHDDHEDDDGRWEMQEDAQLTSALQEKERAKEERERAKEEAQRKKRKEERERKRSRDKRDHGRESGRERERADGQAQKPVRRSKFSDAPVAQAVEKLPQLEPVPQIDSDVLAIELLIAEREELRVEKNWEAADAIRTKLKDTYTVKIFDDERIWRSNAGKEGAITRQRSPAKPPVVAAPPDLSVFEVAAPLAPVQNDIGTDVNCDAEGKPLPAL